MADSRMIELAQELLRVSKAGNAKWEARTANYYKASFRDFALFIFRSDAGDYLLTLRNDKDEDVDSLYVSTGDREHPAYLLLRDIYALARGQAVDVEGNISRALDFLRST
jgi:hypothetical protein